MYCDKCISETCKDCKNIDTCFVGTYSYWIEVDKSETDGKPIFFVGYADQIEKHIALRDWIYIISQDLKDPLSHAKKLASCSYVTFT